MRESLCVDSRSATQTQRIAAALAALLGAGDVVALIGELGTGKTCFIAAACRALGYRGRVRSPSFTLLNIYGAARPIHHFDLYRWEPDRRAAELAEWDELMEGEGLSFIEWADRLADGLPERAIIVRLEHAGQTRRRMTIEVDSARLPAIRRALAGETGS